MLHSTIVLVVPQHLNHAVLHAFRYVAITMPVVKGGVWTNIEVSVTPSVLCSCL